MSTFAEVANHFGSAAVRYVCLQPPSCVYQRVKRRPSGAQITATDSEIPQLNSARRTDHRCGSHAQPGDDALLRVVRPKLLRHRDVGTSRRFPAQRKPAEQRERPCGLSLRPASVTNARPYPTGELQKALQRQREQLPGHSARRFGCFRVRGCQ